MFYHCNEISFCNASHGDLFCHMFNLLLSLYSLCVVDHEYIKYFAERYSTFVLRATDCVYVLYFVYFML